MLKNTIIRTISAAVGLVIFFIAVSLDVAIFEAIVAAVGMFMVCEVFYAIGGKAGDVLLGICAGAVLNIGIYFNNSDLIIASILFCVIMFAVTAVVCNEKYSFLKCASMSFIAIYIVLSMSFIARLRSMNLGIHLMFIAFICAWISDTGAYFCGLLFGKHKLIEKISPKKTVEGAVGGVVFSGIGGIVFGIIEKLCFSNSANLAALFVICAIGSVFGQFGDLIESMIKRYFKIKDFGNIMPGHGGLTDRFDSVMLTAPYTYYAIMICACLKIAVLG